jgi:toxin ParE1/3/4
MARVTKTVQAERDLLEIWVYVAEQSSLEAADRLLRTIDAQCDILADLPGMGRAREELLSGLRSFPIGKYLLYYRRTDEGISLLRVLHGARNIEDLFPGSSI